MRAVALAPLSLFLLAPGAQAKLEVQEVKAMYPLSWAERPALEFFATGDGLAFRYYLAGAGRDERGIAEVDATVRLEGAATGLALFKTLPITKGFVGQHGGRFASGFAEPLTGAVKPGEYKLTLTFKDRQTSEEASFTRTIRIKAADLCIAQLGFARDAEYKVPAAPVVAPNENLYFRYAVVGFDRSNNKARLTTTLQFLDPDGKEMLPNASSQEGTMEDPRLAENPDAVFAMNNLYVAFPRSGRYVIRVEVTDHGTQKSVRRDTPVTVVDP
jgi:hypothetical protein